MDKPVAIASGVKIIKAFEFQLFLSAEDLLKSAKKEVARIKDDAKAVYESEKQKGYNDGVEQGKAQMAERITETNLQCQEYLNSIESQIVDTILSALKIILADMGDEAIMAQMVSKALRGAKQEDRLIIKVSPFQVENVRRLISELHGGEPLTGAITITPEPTLDMNGCIVSSKAGSTDISLDVQLDTIRATLTNRIRQSKPL